MKVKLPELPNKTYLGNPMKLKDGEVREVEHNKEIDLLLNEGAIEPATDTPSIESKPYKVKMDKPKEIPKTTPTIKRPTVARTTRTSNPIEIKKKGLGRRF